MLNKEEKQYLIESVLQNLKEDRLSQMTPFPISLRDKYDNIKYDARNLKYDLLSKLDRYADEFGSTNFAWALRRLPSTMEAAESLEKNLKKLKAGQLPSLNKQLSSLYSQNRNSIVSDVSDFRRKGLGISGIENGKIRFNDRIEDGRLSLLYGLLLKKLATGGLL